LARHTRQGLAARNRTSGRAVVRVRATSHMRQRAHALDPLGDAVQANHPGLFGIAAPVPRAGGGAAELSVSVSGPEGRWTREAAVSHVDALLRCCGRVSVLLPTRR